MLVYDCVVVCVGVRWCVLVCDGVYWCEVVCVGVRWCVLVSTSRPEVCCVSMHYCGGVCGYRAGSRLLCCVSLAQEPVLSQFLIPPVEVTESQSY